MGVPTLQLPHPPTTEVLRVTSSEDVKPFSSVAGRTQALSGLGKSWQPRNRKETPRFRHTHSLSESQQGKVPGSNPAWSLSRLDRWCQPPTQPWKTIPFLSSGTATRGISVRMAYDVPMPSGAGTGVRRETLEINSFSQ